MIADGENVWDNTHVCTDAVGRSLRGATHASVRVTPVGFEAHRQSVGILRAATIPGELNAFISALTRQATRGQDKWT